MWPRLKNSPHTYAHEGLESIFLFEFIELQWVQTDFLRLSDNNNKKYSGSATNVDMPNSVTYEGNTYSVKSLGNFCSVCCSLASIAIPESVTSL